MAAHAFDHTLAGIMKLSWKFAVAGTATFVLVTIVLGMVFPALEVRSRYCFYCGRESASLRVMGVPVWRSNSRSLYSDTVETPAHAHRIIEICGSRLWLFRGSEDWDELGWTGTPIRKALVEGLTAHPEIHAEIFREFLALDPEDHEAKLLFVKKYRTAVTQAGSVSPLLTD